MSDLKEYIIAETFDGEASYDRDSLEKRIVGFLNEKGLSTEPKKVAEGLLKQGILREVERPDGKMAYRVSLNYKDICGASTEDPTYRQLQDFVSENYNGLFKKKFEFSEGVDRGIKEDEKRLLDEVRQNITTISVLEKDIADYVSKKREDDFTKEKRGELKTLKTKAEELSKAFHYLHRTTNLDLHYGRTLVGKTGVADEELMEIVSKLNYRNLPEVLQGLAEVASRNSKAVEDVSSRFKRYSGMDEVDEVRKKYESADREARKFRLLEGLTELRDVTLPQLEAERERLSKLEPNSWGNALANLKQKYHDANARRQQILAELKEIGG